MIGPHMLQTWPFVLTKTIFTFLCLWPGCFSVKSELSLTGSSRPRWPFRPGSLTTTKGWGPLLFGRRGAISLPPCCSVILCGHFVVVSPMTDQAVDWSVCWQLRERRQELMRFNWSVSCQLSLVPHLTLSDGASVLHLQGHQCVSVCEDEREREP